MKIMRRIIYFLVTLFILLIAFIAFIAYTPAGLNFALSMVEKVTHQQFSYQNVTGTLAEGMHFQSIAFQNNEINLTGNDLHIAIDPWPLFWKSLEIKQLTATKINVHIKPQADTESDSSQAFPLAIFIEQLQINSLIYQQPNLKLDSSDLNGALMIGPFKNSFEIKSELNWAKLQVTLPDNFIQLSNATLNIQGNSQHYFGTLNSKVNYNKSHNITINTHFSGSLEGIKLSKMNLVSELGSTEGLLAVTWAPHLQWHINIKQKQLNKQVVAGTQFNHLQFHLQTQGNYQNQHYQGDITLENLHGFINQQKISGELNLKFSPDNLIFNQSKIVGPNIDIELSGNLKQKHALHWSIAISKLSNLLPKAKGNISSKGKISYINKKLLVNSDLQVKQLSAFGINVASLDGKVILLPNNKINAKLTSKQIDIANTHVKKLNLTINGSAQANTITATVEYNGIDLNSQFSGQYQQKQWRGKITRFDLKQARFGTWHLVKPTPLSINADENNAISINLEKLRLRQNQQTIALSLLKTIQQTHIVASITNLHVNEFLSAINPNITTSIHTNSKLNLNFSYNKAKQTTAQLSADLTPGVLTVLRNNQKIFSSKIDGQIRANLNQHKLDVNSNIFLNNKKALTLGISIANPANAKLKQSIDGTLSVNFNNFSWLPIMIPQITQAYGNLEGNIRLSGTLAKPQFQGFVKFLNGNLYLQDYGLKLKDINITANADSFNKIAINANLKSGPGTLEVFGNINLADKNIPAKIKIVGNDILIMNANGYTVYASPNLEISKKNQNFWIDGSVTIPKANIAPEQLADGSVSLSDDVKFVNNGSETTMSSLVNGNINLILGKEVKVNAKGVTGNMAGSIQIHLNTQGENTADGIISLENGKFSAYGQELKISTGKIIYTGGDLTNPGLNIVAEKTITATSSTNNTIPFSQNFSIQPRFSQRNNIKVGVKVNGTVKNYKVSLFSIPATYSQSNILSLILTGTTTDNISNDSAALLLKAAASLNLGGNSILGITQELKQSFGLDELSLGQENVIENGNTTQTTSLILGKHITPRLFISYSIGLLDPVQVFRATYYLTKNWSIQANESKQDAGADIFYTIQKNSFF